MIRYALLCDDDHAFESWFDHSSAFDKLQSAKLIECPHCGSQKIRKDLMSPQIGGLRANKRATNNPSIVKTPDIELQKLQQEAVELARKIRHHVEKNADNVGDKFASEARKIHFEEVEPHNIYGEATPDEVSELVEDGIEIAPLPALPEDKN